tara:strand:+ start:763 stop:1611 length:849 start_codon:yes stop_codon:yes gene_type:complete
MQSLTLSLVEPSRIAAQSSGLTRGSHAGFSLVELSIVLVILGLLTGGILTGQSLIRAAELRAVTTEFQRYQTALQSFRDKYFALPGDMRNATAFWGSMTNCGAASPSGTGTQTCNGDGNGIINSGAALQTSEIYGFWQHLANAGLIEGSYSGISGATSSLNSVINQNVPGSKVSNAGWFPYYLGQSSGSTSQYAMDYGNAFTYGADDPTMQTYLPILTPAELWGIDTKIDDGKPAMGKLIARFWNNACSAADNGSHSNTNLVASYKLSASTIECSIIFRQLF